MKFNEFYNKVIVENTDSISSMEEDENKLRDLDYFSDPKKYENVQKELFEKYFNDVHENSDWKVLKDVLKNKHLENLYDVSQIWNRIYEAKIKDIQDKIKKGIEEGTIDNKGYDSFANTLESAWVFGLDNAAETYNGDDEHPNYWNLAYGSIGDTSPYIEGEDVRNWYKTNGHIW
jgi:hypothetical protein